MLSRQPDSSAFPFLSIDQPRPTGPPCLLPRLESSVSGGRSFAEKRREKREHEGLLFLLSVHSPGLQRDVAVQHPAVLELHGFWSGGPFSSAWGRGVDGVAAPSQSVSVQAIGRLVGQCVVVVWWRQRRAQRGLTVVVCRACGQNKKRAGPHFR